MQLAEIYLKLGESGFGQLIRGISIGKLKTYQVYEPFKVRAHLAKLNTESLRKATPRFWSRLSENDEDFARDLGQAILVSHLDMMTAVLDFLGISNEGGFFAKDIDAKPHLTEGWKERVFEKFRGAYPEPLLLFYINHLAWELTEMPEPFVPTGAS
jgi:hypothetical protein